MCRSGDAQGAARWFSRLLDLLPVDARDVFPTESLLDHIPALILELSEYLRHPEAGAIAAPSAADSIAVVSRLHEALTGVGLGLSIAHDCVRAMGGRIEVISEAQRGTAFIATLPRTPAAATRPE